MKNILIIIVLAFLLFNCEETIPLDLEQTEPVLVIEGLVTNNPDYNYVKLSQTGAFNAKGISLISGAKVNVVDSKGINMIFEEAEPGYYLPSETFSGEVGNSYTLSVEYNGQIYTAIEQMPTVTTIDSSNYLKIDDLDEDYEEEERFYEWYLYTSEPQDEENFYLFKFYRNDEILDDDGTSVYIFDDVILGERIEGIATPSYYALGDTARVEMFGVTRRAYRYYLDLSNNLNNDGGLFSGIPANAGTNISNDAIGYFLVAAIDIEEVRIE